MKCKCIYVHVCVWLIVLLYYCAIVSILVIYNNIVALIHFIQPSAQDMAKATMAQDESFTRVGT